MNSKPTKSKENDTSMIIGNLPTRLQRKIAEEAGTTGKNQHVKKIAKQKQTAAGIGDEMIRGGKNGKLSKGSSNNITLKPRLLTDNSSECNSEQVNSSAEVSKLTNGNVKPNAKCSRQVPGIIRLRNLEQQAAAESSKHPKKSREEEFEMKNNAIAANSPRRARQEELRAAELLTPSLSRPNSPRIMKTPWLDLLDASIANEIKTREREMMEIMQKMAVKKNLKRFNEARRCLMNIFTQLLKDKLKLCWEHKIDNFFWKLIFYSVREHVERQRDAATYAEMMKLFFKEGIEFYTYALQQLNTAYLVDEQNTVIGGNMDNSPPNLSPTFDGSADKPVPHRLATLAKVVAQKFLIYLGDLCRYLAKWTKTDLSEASKYYKQAQELIPTNGIPYNQLAVVSLQSQKKFDAVYYHARSLFASNPIKTAKESLLVIFDEYRIKHDAQSTSLERNKKNGANSSVAQTTRSETWIYPNGERSVYKCNLSKGNLEITNDMNLHADGSNISSIDYDSASYRSFISSYMYIIGKLYTGIGMETIYDNQKECLGQFLILLKFDPLAITRFRFLQMMAINIFVVEYNIQAANRREVLSHAFNFNNQFLGFMLRKANDLVSGFVHGKIEENRRFADLTTLCQCIRIYIEYFTMHLREWEAGRNKERTYVDWNAEFHLFFRKIKQMIHSARKTHKYDYDEHVPNGIYFEEDNTLSGYLPLAEILPKNICAPSPELKQFWARAQKIIQTYNMFDEYRKRLQAAEETDFILTELGEKFVEDMPTESSVQNCISNYEEEEEEDDSSDSSSISELSLNFKAIVAGAGTVANGYTKESAQLAKLTKLKRKLHEKTVARMTYNHKLEELLKFVDNQMNLEVRPKYLMPDTNCFIDSVEDFRKLLLEFDHYMLIVPLTVYKELDGLSRGNKDDLTDNLPESRKKHYAEVMTNAKNTLDFIKSAKNVRFATTKGSFISDKFFESVQEESASNDDKILATALSLSQSLNTINKEDGKCIIRTELVLVTTDRNLRVKAYSNNLAVIDLSNFLKWARKGANKTNGRVL